MGLDYRATELYSSGEQNAAFSYIILRLTYIRGLIHGIGRGVPNVTFRVFFSSILFEKFLSSKLPYSVQVSKCFKIVITQDHTGIAYKQSLFGQCFLLLFSMKRHLHSIPGRPQVQKDFL